jgi:hypothetical protein
MKLPELKVVVIKGKQFIGTDEQIEMWKKYLEGK